MSDHTIKISRALRIAAVGRFPGSASAMLDRIPASAIVALPSKQLAAILDAMWGACQESKSLAVADAISEGAIWDARHQRLIEIAA